MRIFDGKKRKLLFGLLFDALGMVSLLIPGIGPALHLVWAPVAGWLMTRMYPGKTGRAAAFLAFAEEILPGTDVIPTFTLMWVYTFLIRKKAAPSVRQT